MNPATAFATVFVDELARCGVTDVVVAPGSRSTPLALAVWQRAQQDPGFRLHVRIDERSASFLALGLGKASGRPAVVLTTSGTAAAHLHAAVIEAGESCVPLLVLTADRPPELRGTGANQAIDQLKLYGAAVRWFCEMGVPEPAAGMNAYWRSLACRAVGTAAGGAGGAPGPVHVNVPLREPLVPGADTAPWPEPLAGRGGGQPWTRVAAARPPAGAGVAGLPWAERGVVVCGDGCPDPVALVRLAEEAGWPVLAEPSSGARQGPNALSAYPYLLACEPFVAAHRPEIIVTGGRPGLSRPQTRFLATGAARHVVVAQAPGQWADPARSATDVVAGVRLAGSPGPFQAGWLASWQAADVAARQAADAVLAAEASLTEPGIARDLTAALPDGALLWAASSLPVRDLDHHMSPRSGLRLLASRGASGIDGLISSAIGAALAHQSAGGGPAAALLGDLAFVHDLPGLVLGPDEPRPDLALVVVNNQGGGIFSLLEQAALGAPFERLFGTPQHVDLGKLAGAAGVAYQAVTTSAELARACRGDGLRIVEAHTSRADGAALRARLGEACTLAAARPGG